MTLVPLGGAPAQWSNRPFSSVDECRVWVESPLHHDELIVYWSPKRFAENRYPIGWNVYRGVGPDMVVGSPQIEKLNSSPITVPVYRDTGVVQAAPDTRVNTHWYYLVTEVFSDGTETRLDRPVTLGQWFGGEDRPTLSPIRIYREFKRRKWIILDRTAERVDYLVRRRAGTRCTCFAPEYESCSRSECNRCFGTSWLRGFELIRSVKCRILTIQETLKLMPKGLVFDSRPRAWLVDFPIARNGDVIVRRSGERYEIDMVEPVIHQGVLTEQNFALTVLPETHPIHLYDIAGSDAP